MDPEKLERIAAVLWDAQEAATEGYYAATSPSYAGSPEQLQKQLEGCVKDGLEAFQQVARLLNGEAINLS
jgi:uncharacterized protein YfaQ (DUF2300 family)